MWSSNACFLIVGLDSIPVITCLSSPGRSWLEHHIRLLPQQRASLKQRQKSSFRHTFLWLNVAGYVLLDF